MRRIFAFLTVLIITLNASPVFASEQQADIGFKGKYIELQKLINGESAILNEFKDGLDKNLDRVVNTKEYHAGGEIFKYKDGSNAHLNLFYEKYNGNIRYLSGIASNTGGFYGIEVGKDKIDSLAGMLGAPDVYEEASDATSLPIAVYIYPNGSLTFTCDKDKTINRAAFRIADNTDLLNTASTLALHRYENADPLNVPLLVALAKTDMIPQRAYYDFKWPVSRGQMAYFTVGLYEYLTLNSPPVAKPNPYAEKLSDTVLKAISLNIFSDIKGEVLKPDVQLTKSEVNNMLDMTLKAAGVEGIKFENIANVDDLATYEYVCVTIYNLLKSQSVYDIRDEKNIRIYHPNSTADKLVYVDQKIIISPSFTGISEQTDYKALEAGLKQIKKDVYKDIDITVNGVALDKAASTIHVDVSADILKYSIGSSLETLALESIAMTFMDYYKVDHIMLSVNGKNYQGEHIVFAPGETLDRGNIGAT